MTNEGVLAEHINRIGGWERGHLVATGILNDPQGHLDALVAAGVLVADPVPWTTAVAYYLPVHVHDWRVAMDVDDVNAHVGTTVRLICHECHATRDVTNQLPLEVPE